MQALRSQRIRRWIPWMTVPAVVAILITSALSQTKKDAGPPNKTSYDQVAPVLLGQETFQERMTKDKADKPGVMARQKKLLEERYNLASRPDNR